MKRLKLAFYLFLTAFSIISGCGQKELYKDKQVMMGTFVEVISPDKRSSSIVFNEIKQIEGLLSKYRQDSEIYRLNEKGSLQLSPETYYILKKSAEFCRLSGGSFDITVAPLMDIWGFTDKNFTVPRKSEIEKALKLTGCEKIIFNDKNNVVKFNIPGMKVDLGAIAKGFALDCAVKKLKENNINSCLLNIGGQIYCLGARSSRPWRIAVRSPREKGKTLLLDLKDKGVSTSGDYEQYFRKNNLRYCHIIDPKTGYPANSGIIAATVTGPDNLVNDMLSTSIFVMGKARGRDFAAKFSGANIEVIEEE